MEEFFSLEWFREKMETSVDRVLDARIGEKIDALIDKVGGGEAPRGIETPYRSIKLINESLTVVMKDGTIFSKPNATEDHYRRLLVARSKEEILAIIQDKEVAREKEAQVAEAKKLTAIADGFKLLGKLKDFTLDGDCLYLKGTSRSIPQLLVEKFTAVVGKYMTGVSIEGIKPFVMSDITKLEDSLAKDDEYQGLKNFFMWCCLNPRAEVADSLYGFLDRNGMKITKQGFFVALRNVVVVDSKDSGIVDFISNAYNKVKAVWKKNPNDYRVVKCKNTYCLEKIDSVFSDGEFIGNLTHLYLDLPSMKENRYTDNWTRKFDIRVGQVVSMPSSQCDWSTQDCARAGLHFAGHTAPYVLCGDTTVFTLHNPMKVVGIGSEKGRCWEYLPFMTTNVKEAGAIMNSKDFDFLQLDEEYAIRELEGLAAKAQEGFTTETNKYNFNLPSISSAEINSIVLSLGEMKKSIAKRVSLLD